MNDENILITGGSGFVGGHIANSLCEEQGGISVLAREKFFRNNSAYDISKAKTYFGYNPSINLREGVEKMVEWYLSEYNPGKD